MQGRSSYPRPDKTLPLKIVSLKTSPSDNNNFLRCSRSAGSTSTYSASTATAAAAPGADRNGCRGTGGDRKGCSRRGGDRNGCRGTGGDRKGCSRRGGDRNGCRGTGGDRNGCRGTGGDRKGCSRRGGDRKGCSRRGGGQWYEPRAKMEHVLLLTKGCLTVQFEGDAFAFFRCPRLKPIYPRRTTFTYKFHTS